MIYCLVIFFQFFQPARQLSCRDLTRRSPLRTRTTTVSPSLSGMASNRFESSWVTSLPRRIYSLKSYGGSPRRHSGSNLCLWRILSTSTAGCCSNGMGCTACCYFWCDPATILCFGSAHSYHESSGRSPSSCGLRLVIHSSLESDSPLTKLMSLAYSGFLVSLRHRVNARKAGVVPLSNHRGSQRPVIASTTFCRPASVAATSLFLFLCCIRLRSGLAIEIIGRSSSSSSDRALEGWCPPRGVDVPASANSLESE